MTSIKSIAVSFLLLYSTSYAYSQSKISVGLDYPKVKAYSKYYFYMNDEILSVKYYKDAITLQKQQGKNLSLQVTQVYEELPKKFEVETVMQFGEKIYFVYSWWDGAQEHLDAREIDFESGKFTGPVIELITEKQKLAGELAVMGFYKWGIVGKYSFNFSSDSSRFLIQYSFRPKEGDMNRNFEFVATVFDPSLKQLWTRKVVMPYAEKKFKVLDFDFNRNESIHLALKVFTDNTQQEKNLKGERNYKIEILKITRADRDPVKIAVDVNDLFIQSLKLIDGPNGTPICTGFYNGGRKRSNVDGVIVFGLGEDNSVVNMRTHEIPLELLNQKVSSQKQQSKAEPEEDNVELKNLFLRHILFDDRGGMLLVGEQFLLSPGVQNHAPAYFFDDIFLTRISSTGDLEWMKRIPKRQRGYEGIGRMSYKLFIQGKQCYFLFLDHAANRDLPTDKRPRAYIDNGSGFLTVYILNADSGEVSKNYLLDTRDRQGHVVCDVKPYNVMATDPGVFVLEGYNTVSEKDALYKIELLP